MEKIIYLSVNESSEKINRDFFINKLKKKFKVEFWSIKNLLNHNYKSRKKKKFNNIYDFENDVIKNKKNLFINIVPNGYKTYFIFKILSKYNIKFININWGFLPETKLNYYLKFLSIFNDLRNFVDNFIYKIQIKKKKIKKPIRTFVAGSKNYQKNFIKFNLCDHDQYLISKKITSKKKHIIFLDQAMTSHSDTHLNRKKNLYNQHFYYYKSLNEFFKKTELKFRKNIVISKHPLNMIKYNPFKKRKYYTLKTANLVRESLFVIAHDSLSTSYAIFNYKPIIFIYTNQIKNHSIDTHKQYLQIKVLADTLGSKLLNIDNYKEEELIFNNLDKKKYDDFKYKYLVSKNTEYKLSSKIFLNNIMKINEKYKKNLHNY